MAPVRLNNSIPAAGVHQSQQTQRKTVGDGVLRQANRDFAAALRTEVAAIRQAQGGEVKMSAHAARRLADRNVELSASDQARLEAAVDRIQGKGADKSLVLMDDLALLVSARHRVVITALDAASAREGVFTNIDSAVII